ncbi:DNA-directed DNA polymerase II small subunit [Candidatus Woesearchaeota archaeon]|nr:DNA-directed DNA polymerase II small subunit [Candidatus Woesearchaeota archaeon]
MQEEITTKKREIINFFLKNGILVNPDFLKEIGDYEQISSIFNTLKSKNIEELEKVSKNLSIITKEPKTTEQKPHAKPIDDVKITSSHKEDPKKREPQDFIDYFNNRYKALEKILRQHNQLKNTTSINKLNNKKEKEASTIIGMVSNKQTTKNGNLIFTLEDPTKQIKVIVNKNKPKLFSDAKDVVLDEVIGITGVKIGDVIFVNEIIWPDIPMEKELKKYDQEKYAIFLSDIHVGSTKFLPEDFEKFLRWINAEMGNQKQRHIAKNVEYIFIAGDLIDGCGVYPDQDKELTIKDVYQQYQECARLLKQIPGHIPIIICPGNHDALRLSEPQPPLPQDFAKPMYEMNNTVMVSNPSTVNISSSSNFPGFDVMMYHGYSFDYFVAEVDSLRNNGGYNRADLIMKFLLKRRHLAPTHLSTQYIPDTRKDPLVIEKVPDFFLSGHIHKSITANYKNSTLICGSCWQGKTTFQERMGHNPEPSRVPIVNLQTREVKILKFGQ